MKKNKKEHPHEVRKSDAPAQPLEPMWQPSWQWHLKVLGGIYVALTIVYFGVSTFLSRVPAPYKVREVPKELTPWMK